MRRPGGIFEGAAKRPAGQCNGHGTRYLRVSIDLLVRLYLTTVPYGDFLREKSRLNLEIIRLAAQHGCSFAFPTTTVDLPDKN